MKQFLVFFLFTFISIDSFSQNIYSNHYKLPVFGNEIAFVQKDSVKNAKAADLYIYATDWLSQTYNVNSFSKQVKDKQHISTEIHFKIDDENIKEPLNYTGTVTIAYKDGLIRINLHKLSYTTGIGKSKIYVDVTKKIRNDVKTQADKQYPTAWDSLKEYGAMILKSFNRSIQEKNKLSL